MIKSITMYSVVCDRCGKTFCEGDTTITGAYGFQLPQGSIKKLIGRELSFSDEPVELKEE